MADGKPTGYIKLYRKQFDGNDLLWDQDKTPFDRRSAWVWLLQAAAFRDGYYVSGFGSDQLKRGEFVASLRYLGQRWRWGKWKVGMFLKCLERAQRISVQRTGQHGTVYLVVNYDSYQGGQAKDRTADRTPDRTPTGHLPDKVEEGKEGEEGNTSGGDGWESWESGGTYPPDFELMWQTYPRRAGGSNKAGAFREARGHLRKGVAYDVMFEGTKRYAAKCIAQGIVGTRFVQDAKTFYGRDKHFLDEHDTADSAPVTSSPIAARLWSEIQRTGILHDITTADWQRHIAEIVASGAVESRERFEEIWRGANIALLRSTKNERQAVEHITEVLARRAA